MCVVQKTTRRDKGASGLVFGDSEGAPQRLEKMESGLRNSAGAQDPVWDFRSVRR
jgi:hypothetical protein